MNSCIRRAAAGECFSRIVAVNRATVPGLINGHTVRVRYDESDWRRKVELIRILPQRANEMRFEDGFGPPPEPPQHPLFVETTYQHPR